MAQFKRFSGSESENYNSNYVGRAGELTWDPSNGLRIHDGNQSGGNQIGITSYQNLNDKPTLFSGSYDDLSDKPTIFDGNYNSLTNKPTYKVTVSAGSGPGGNNQADSLVLAGLNPVTDIPSTWGGDLILQGGAGGANTDLYGEVRIKSGQIGANYEWHFTTDKKIKLPAGGDIVDSTGATAFVSVATLKQIVADSTDFADFQSRIANM